jgi:2-keto-3-deoxy-L-fuconate dehydrogenase
MARDPDFAGKTALITGAASGIGAATARWLDGRGIGELVLVDLDRHGLDALALSCGTRRIAGDVADPGLWQRLGDDVEAVQLAAINAGIAVSAAIVDTRIEQWRQAMATNLDGAFLALRWALRAMRRGGGGGSIVLTASAMGLKPEAGTAAYGTSKAAMLHLARVAAKESAEAGIRVNAIAPGGVDTPIWDQVPMFQQLVARHDGDRAAAMTAMGKFATPLGRYASADEVAAQIGFLLSSLAATITGAVLVSDGGYTL